MDGSEREPDPLDIVCSNIATGKRYLRGFSSMLDRTGLFSHLLGIRSNAEPTAQCMYPLFQRVQFTLRIGEHEGHIRLVVAHLPDPTGHLRQPGFFGG
jgi:hypothetical protein